MAFLCVCKLHQVRNYISQLFLSHLVIKNNPIISLAEKEQVCLFTLCVHCVSVEALFHIIPSGIQTEEQP